MTKRAILETYTTEELLDGYSDCYKSLYNVRPHYTPSREALIWFWEDYDSNFAAALAEEAEEEYWDAIYAEERAAEEAEAWAANDAARAEEDALLALSLYDYEVVGKRAKRVQFIALPVDRWGREKIAA